MEVTSHKGSHVPPLIGQELWSILLSRESKIMMCRGIDLRERDHCQWTLPTKLLFSLCHAHICCFCFLKATSDGDDSLCWVWSSIFMLFLGFFDYIIGSREFSNVYFCIIVECVIWEGRVCSSQSSRVRSTGVSLSLALCLLCLERSLRDFSQWIAGEFIGGWLAITD